MSNPETVILEAERFLGVGVGDEDGAAVLPNPKTGVSDEFELYGHRQASSPN